MAKSSKQSGAPSDDVFTDSEGRPLKGRALKKARKAARPKKTPWFKQIWQVFQMTRQTEPLIWLWMLLIWVGTIALFMAFGQWVWHRHVIYMTILAVPTGLIGSLFLLTNRAEKAAYARIEGQEGASAAALGQIRRGFTFEDQPVAIDPRSHAMVFRGVGRPGVILVGEGTGGKLTKLMEGERRKVNRVAPDIPVLEFVTGNGEGQVPLRKLARTVQRSRNAISKAEVVVVQHRLKALGGMPLPIPKGIDPMRARPDRKGMRGR
jgi:hypothetical protein